MPNRVTRRGLLEASAVAAVASLAGCASLRPSGTDTADPAAGGPPATDTPSAGGREIQQVGKSIRPAVVSVETRTSSTGGGGGTGWFVDDHHVVTNSHVVDGASSITCWTLDGESFEPEVVDSTDYRAQPYHDVALLRTEFDAPGTLSLGDESALTEGQPVVQVGHPFAVGNWVISSGEFVREREFGDTILTTTPNMSGNSGSPLVTLEETVVGLTTGSVPKEQPDRARDEAPEPVEPDVYESYEDATYATHDKASVVGQYVEEWTAR